MPQTARWPCIQIGVSPTNPDRLFTVAEGTHYAHGVNQKRRSFFDLLVSLLRDSLRLDLVERFFLEATVSEERDDDNPFAILKTIDSLVVENQIAGIYHTGQEFGKLLTAIDYFEDYILEVADPYFGEGTNLLDVGPQGPHETSWEYFKRRIGPVKDFDPKEEAPSRTVAINQFANQLKQTLGTNSCHYAQTALSEIRSLHFEVDESDSPDPLFSAAMRSLSQSRDARMCLWLAFGHVLGVLHDADSDFKDQDAGSAVPRAFRLKTSDTPDDVLKQITIVERDLSNDRDFDPKDAIARLIFLPEAIAKRVWPNELGGASGSTLT